MGYVTVEVEIDHGRIVAHEPEKLPAVAKGILTILPPVSTERPQPERQRVKFPIIEGDGKHLINPTREELDASLWGN
jgi:hypothetical protein